MINDDNYFMKQQAIIKLFLILLFLNVVFIKGYSQNPDVVLKELTGWGIDSITPGLIKYTYRNYYPPHRANQIVHVLEVDYTSPRYSIEIKYVNPRDSLSSVARSAGAIAGINGSYELDATFVKTNGNVYSQVTLPPSHIRFWKHEGAIFYDNITKMATLGYGTNGDYFSSNIPNILSGAPMLIDNFNPVGTTFIGDVTGINLNSLPKEDYRSHSGLRHPRTVVALTETNKMLLVVVDGRRNDVSAGMNAKELTEFLIRYFNPKSALNIDGGGSSTMYIKNSNLSDTDVVNYPTDNGKFDHYGQRQVRTFILVKEDKSDEIQFAGGTGTVSDPFLINAVAHMEEMHNVNYTNPVYYKLTADIDMAGVNWIPINLEAPYDKIIHFDGNGHIIKNLTVVGTRYASLFGVLCGSCKNLGVINANIQSTSGGGIIGGYLGVKTPSNALLTGIIENCYTTGTVSGPNAVGGIVGNIGGDFETTQSIIRNCYSTATVTSTNTSGNSRAGGITGIIFLEGGILENTYATGKIISYASGAAGIAGFTARNVKGVVALNDSVINKVAGNIGRISAFMGGAVEGPFAQGENCWAYDGMVVKNGEYILTESDYVQGEVVVRQTPYDGVSKSIEFLSDPMNYFLELEWDFASDNNVWAQTMSNGKPIFQWLIDRPDYTLIDGHNLKTDILTQHKPTVGFYFTNGQLNINGINDIKRTSVYSTTGQLIAQKTGDEKVILNEKGLYIIIVETSDQRLSKKAIYH